MDRETLSQYGWIVIVLIILSILISLATPFASSIRTSITDGVETFQKQVNAKMNNIYGNTSGGTTNSSGGSGGGSTDGSGDESTEGGEGGATSVSTPTLSVNGTMLAIVNDANDAERYEIYNGINLIATVPAAGIATEYDLSTLPAGIYQLSVVGKADGVSDSVKVMINYIVEEPTPDYSSYAPIASTTGTSVTLTHDDNAEEYRISVNGSVVKTVTSLGDGKTSTETVSSIKYGSTVTIAGYKDGVQIGNVKEFTSTESTLTINTVTLDTTNKQVVVDLAGYTDLNYYKVTKVTFQLTANGFIKKDMSGNYLTDPVTWSYSDGDLANGNTIVATLKINGLIVDEKLLTVSGLKSKLAAPTLSVSGTTLTINDGSGGLAMSYDVYDGDTLITTVYNSEPRKATYNLSALPAGTHVIGVVAKGDDKMYGNSDKVVVSYVVAEALGPGLYKSGSNYTELLMDWDTLIANRYLSVSGTEITRWWGASGDLLIPDGITDIGTAFKMGGGLTGVTIPDSVTVIVDDAFQENSSLTHVIIGNGVTSIGQYAFYNCTSLENVVIGSSVAIIGANAFLNCPITAGEFKDIPSIWSVNGLVVDVIGKSDIVYLIESRYVGYIWHKQ